MLVSELKEIAKNHSVNTTGLDKQGLISAIIENQSTGNSAPAEQDGSAIKKRGRPRVTKGTIIDEPIVHGKAKEKIIQKVMAVSPIAETNEQVTEKNVPIIEEIKIVEPIIQNPSFEAPIVVLNPVTPSNTGAPIEKLAVTPNPNPNQNPNQDSKDKWRNE
jgi:hypothetical protein